MEGNSPTEDQHTMNQIKEHQHNKMLNAAELGDLFANYLGDSLFCCIFEHHLQVVKDDEIKDYLEFAFDNAMKHLRMIKEIYTKENIPLPIGFGEQDVRKEAPGLFSDVFMLFYTTQMARAGLLTYGDALSTATRQDIIEHFKVGLNDSIDIYEKGTHLLLTKGINIATPTTPYPQKVDFVEKESFISVIAGKSRPLTTIEIKQLQVNINTNILGKALMLGFSQVASSEKLRNYFQEGVKVADRQIKQLGKFLLNEYLPTPNLMDAHISDSTIPPFSDKLMLYHASLANTIGISNYGLAISKTMRHDLHGELAILTADIGKYANEGINLTIGNGWLEEPPTAADRIKLSKESPSNKPVE
ncbi:DUF3231 family protein [Salipaludibacillus sp. HK11]|uniref:DUF3231 family protein n=1 Tax=Salipaludibacillus sp. HK11 TaxID=3394320 RepID=UPI0039FBF25B